MKRVKALFTPAMAIVLVGISLSASLYPQGVSAAGLNDTGQQSCYDATDTAVACSATVGGNAGVNPGQDARYGRDARATKGTLVKLGAGAAGFDFTKICMSGEVAGTGACPANPTANTGAIPSANEWACTRDNVTGIVWSLESITGINWNDATSSAAGQPIATYNAASRCGKSSGWRVPARRELWGITLFGSTGIDLSFFPNTVSGTNYWASEPESTNAANAYYVGFSNNNADSFSQTKTIAARVRLAWAPSAPVGPSLTTNADGSVTDATTALIWDQCTWGQTGSNCAGTATSLSWANALAAVTAANAANYKGRNDWRMPNAKEMESIFQLELTATPYVDSAAFPNTPTNSNLWTSTTRESTPSIASQVRPNGTINSAFLKVDPRVMRLVRGGDSFDLFALDTTPPETTILTTPTDPSGSSAASFTFTGTDDVAVTNFDCSIDGAAFAACTSPQSYSGLAAGSHTFQVRAQDEAGNLDPTPAIFTWTISAAPVTIDTTITGGPANGSSTSVTTASFSFTGTHSVAGTALTFECSLDGAAFTACTSPQTYNSLSVLAHTFAVRARDAAGNVDSTPASVTWNVVTPNPVTIETTITNGPVNGSTITSTNQLLTYSGTHSVAGTPLTFECSLDGAAFSACPASQTLTGLTLGSHTFEVRARDAAGNFDPTPASVTWIVASDPGPIAQAVAVPALSAQMLALLVLLLAGAMLTFSRSRWSS
jgi:Protein of unknown function (DUF1566)